MHALTSLQLNWGVKNERKLIRIAALIGQNAAPQSPFQYF